VITGSAAAPTITINGTNLPKEPPEYDNSNTTCGDYGAGNGYLFDHNFWWSSTNLTAGYGIPLQSGSSCVGMIVEKWTTTQIVFTFGKDYSGFTWSAKAGDSYTIYLYSLKWNGTVTFS